MVGALTSKAQLALTSGVKNYKEVDDALIDPSERRKKQEARV